MLQLSSPAKKLILILILFLLALYISSPIQKKFNLTLGLDLAGGSHLVFEADTSKISDEKKKTSLSSLKDVIERRVNLFGIAEPNVQTSNFEGKDRIVVELPGIKDTKQAVDLIGKTAQLLFASVELPDSTPSAITVDTNNQEQEFVAMIPTDLTGADLAESSVTFDQTGGQPSVSLTFTKEGGEKFAKITEENLGKRVAIILDNEIISSPTVQEKITGGQAQITGNFTLDEAKKLSIQLNAGALPVPITLIEERTVGATLGVESVAKSVKAGIVGIFMVCLFMVLAYGRFGIIADLGLIVFGVLTLALYKLMGVVLTLPGIAGFLLSVGMAVDSNILIFERYKEEKGQRSVANALEVSFGRAWDSIRDANIATLVTAFILANPLDWSFLHTSGPVRGFAITLAIGIGISLFTGIVVSRNLLRVFVKK